jgi:sulfatase maturation enzyme AslB (radical SAM superfamily)
MPTTLTLRFQKFDDYQNAVFICTAKNPDELEQFQKLTKFHKQLEEKKYDSFLPIYSNPEHEYATVRTVKNSRFTKMSDNSVYEIKFQTKKKNKDLKIYVNCHLLSLKLVKKSEPLDEGSDVDFE